MQSQNNTLLCSQNGLGPREQLLPGVEFAFLALTTEHPMPCSHPPQKQVLVVNYCIAGHMDWLLAGERHLYLGAGDFSVHTLADCADSMLRLPNGFYKGFLLFLDTQQLMENPPPLLAGTPCTGQRLLEKFGANEGIYFAGNEQTDGIFRFFYNQPESVQQAYRRLKTLELLLYLQEIKIESAGASSEYQAEQIQTVRKIHEQLMQHLDRRFTIEALARQYLMNPTTLKAVFKSVYGSSLAAHMKEHRMEHAAKLLVETRQSIAEIARAVGYDSQSKFSAAFKEAFQCLPKEYRKKHGC